MLLITYSQIELYFLGYDIIENSNIANNVKATNTIYIGFGGLEMLSAVVDGNLKMVLMTSLFNIYEGKIILGRV